MLIGLNGRKQAGKDTVFERARHLRGGALDVVRVSFADLLYESAAAALGVTVAQLQEWKSDPSVTVQVRQEGPVTDAIGSYLYRRTLAKQSVREYLQLYGTEAHRDLFGPEFWVEQVAATLNSHRMGNRLMFVTDVRFENEARAIRREGGSIVEVIGPEGRVTSDAHASEAPLPEELIDATITNTVRDDGFRQLDRTIDTLLSLHLGRELPSVSAPLCCGQCGPGGCGDIEPFESEPC